MYFTTYDMSRGLVNQRPFSRKKRKKPIKKILNKSGVMVPEIKISQKLKNILSRWLCFTLLIIIGIRILVKSLFFKPEHKIAQIKFSENTLATYQDIELFNFVSNKVKWKNYYILLSNKDEILTDIQKHFPFVWKIDFQLESEEWGNIKTKNEKITIWITFPINLEFTWEETLTQTWIELQPQWYKVIQSSFPLKDSLKDNWWWTLWIELSYIEPRVLVKLNDKKFAVRNENLFVELQEWMLLSTEKIDPKWADTVDNLTEMFTIETPQYISWTNSLSWFFFEVTLDNTLKIAALAKEEFWSDMKRFVYLAWSTRFAIFTSDDKTLYFNFPEWWTIENQRSTQIFKYNTLKEKYQNFDKIEKIDLWALEENKTIIMNY